MSDGRWVRFLPAFGSKLWKQPGSKKTASIVGPDLTPHSKYGILYTPQGYLGKVVGPPQFQSKRTTGQSFDGSG